MSTQRKATRNRGNAMAALLVSVMICGTVSAAVVVTNVNRQKEALKNVAHQRSLQLAEAGADWAIAQLRIHAGEIVTASESRNVAGVGTFNVHYASGGGNLKDDDGDGIIDEPDEDTYAQVTSTGSAGGDERSVQVLLRKSVEVPVFPSAVLINVEAPIIDLNGNAFRISGYDHALDGSPIAGGTDKSGLASPAQTQAVMAQIDSRLYDQIVGTGAVPSIIKVTALDLDKLMQQAQSSATTVLQPGTIGNLDVGAYDPTSPADMAAAYCAGDLHISGNFKGGGMLAIDGDLTISGSLEWKGIVLVRGAVRFTGGGATDRLIGAAAVGEEVDTNSNSTSMTVSGTVDLNYSSDAVDMAAQRLAIMSVMSWREVANP